MKLAKIMKALAHENRLRILNLLNQQALCVCELTNIMEVNQSNASRHLKKLAQADLIEQSREGHWVYYSINQDNYVEYPFLEALFASFKQEGELQADLEKLKTYQQSGLDCSQLDEVDIF
ncbi:MAG: ArsR/SmtB family transcription factor [Bacillota bacterium]